MRIDKYLSHLGYGSRSDVKKLLKQKILKVNEVVVVDSAYKVKPEDVVTLNEEILQYEENVYLLFNKQAGVICANEDSQNETVFDYIEHPQKNELFCVGRLDKDTTGALLITNDGKLDHKLRSYKHHVDKVYIATLQHPFDEKYIEDIKQGIYINDEEKCQPAKITILENNQVELILQEGKYHQVKRMMHACDNEVIALHRSHFANLSVDELEGGTYRSLTEKEIEELKK